MFTTKGFKLILMLLVLAVCVNQSEAGFWDKVKKFGKGVKAALKPIYKPIQKAFKILTNPLKRFFVARKTTAPISKASLNHTKDPNEPKNETFEDKVVRLHQEIRNKEFSSSDKTLTWSREMAKEARVWADKCDNRYWTFSDSRKEIYGQNLYVVKHGNVNVYDAIKEWESTKDLYDPLTGACIEAENCYPFLQMVWPATQNIGCALVNCSDVANLGVPGSILACFYTLV